jgi:hypothetical protein
VLLLCMGFAWQWAALRSAWEQYKRDADILKKTI